MRASSVHSGVVERNGDDAAASTAALPEVTVLVTGYGPFLDRFPINSSWAITESLPSRLAPTPTCPTPIRIVTPSAALKVAYHPTIAAVPRLLSDSYESSTTPPPLPRADVVLHVGMAAGRTHYTLETTAYRDGYEKLRDVDGDVFTPAENAAVWGGCPAVLRPGWDCGDVWRRWRDGVRSELDVRPSDDPGNFMCGFIYYASLAHLWKADRDFGGGGGGDGDEKDEGKREHARSWNVKPETGDDDAEKQRKKKHVMFLHVPDSDKMGDVSNGVEVAEGLIRALVESRRIGRCGDIASGSMTAKGKVGEKKERDMEAMW